MSAWIPGCEMGCFCGGASEDANARTTVTVINSRGALAHVLECMLARRGVTHVLARRMYSSTCVSRGAAEGFN